jgi:hypothetical protein
LCKPGVSEFDPPTDIVGPLRGAIERIGAAGATEARWKSSAAAPWGIGHDIRWVAAQVDTSFIAQVTTIHPGGVL